MIPSTTIAIAGFTGKLANMITKSLLISHPRVRIHGICRTPSKIAPEYLSNPNIQIFSADSNDSAALRRGLAGASACICCYLGDEKVMVEGQKMLIDACIAEKVPRYIASDWSLDFRGLDFGEHPHKDAMKHVQAYLEEKQGKGEIKGVHILNGGFMDVLTSPFAPWMKIDEGVFRYWGSGDETVDMTTYEDAAKFTAEIAVDDNANGFIEILGDSKSPKEMADVYRKVYGAEPKVNRLGSWDDLHAKMTAVFKENPSNIYAWIGLYYQYVMGKEKTQLRKVENHRYPSVKPTTLEDFLALKKKSA
ncbi:NAD(P)-binding protein [Cadophora sp. DSE1049]|nr:NAD(P)-binding protein [Cadophora sp. DSE1049]